MRKIIACLFVVTFMGVYASDLDIYSVGNSLSDGLGLSINPSSWDKRGMLQQLVASSATNTLSRLTKCNVAGAPLSWLWNEVNHAALSTGAPWDVLILQPYDRSLYDASVGAYPWGDVTNSKYFINQAVTSSPDVQPYIYSHWPGIPNYTTHSDLIAKGYTWEEAEALRQQAIAAFESTGGWDGHWDRLYTNVYKNTDYRTRSYFEQLVNILNADRLRPGDPCHALQTKVLMIPVGDVMYELSQRIQADPTLLPRAAGAGGGYYTNMVQMHADATHLKAGVGRFICAATWYAVLYRQNPEGLDYTVYNDSDPTSNQYYDYADPYYEEVTAGFASVVYDTIWDVVRSHAYAGIAPDDIDGDGIPDWWETQYFGGATNATDSVLASNGVNTLKDAYIAGIDPSDPNDRFIVANHQNVLSWSSMTGRVYNVLWSSNLLSGFQVLATNCPFGNFTDLLHNAGSSFYKVDVELAP